MKKLFLLAFGFCSYSAMSQLTRFELSGGKETSTYEEVIQWYKAIGKKSSMVNVTGIGETDAGLPLHLVLVNTEGSPHPTEWHKKNNVVILINNGIHPGEPDGIDASMILVRDIAQKKILLPENVSIAIIPVYNIGGMLNRNSTTRVSQNGPAEYGFRGNSQNLDLNRDFTKCDSREAMTFTKIFHLVKPDVFIDNHVSDGADFQHTMTLITTQYDKLGGQAGKWLKEVFEPAVYKSMKQKSWDLIPYVDFGSRDFQKGIRMFYETPRYSSGYAALFGTFSFIPESHMLKPYKERVKSTYDLMLSFIQKASEYSATIKSIRKNDRDEIIKQKEFPISWKADSSRFGSFEFKGYSKDTVISKATGLMSEKFNHDRTFAQTIRFYNKYVPASVIKKPVAYIIPQGWHRVIERLRLNQVKMESILRDTIIQVTAYRIVDYKSFPRAYESHHKNYGTVVKDSVIKVNFRKGDKLVYVNQEANRYIIEMLEPAGDDSFFAWNFFDGILQQKEGYTDYRWEELAWQELENNPQLKRSLEEKKSNDPVFANNASAILDYIYRNSKYYEKSHMLYPVYRVENQ